MLHDRTRSFICPVISESRKFDESLSSMMLLNSSEEEKPMIDIKKTQPTLSQRRNDEDSVQSNGHTMTSVVTYPWGSHGNPTVGNEWNPCSKVQSAANSDTRLSSYASQPYTIDNEASEMVFHPLENSESLVHEKSIPVPSPIPQELQALVDAFVFGKPLTVLTSNQRFYDIWSLLLPKEYGYVMLGFFRIIGVEVRCLFSLSCSPTHAVI